LDIQDHWRRTMLTGLFIFSVMLVLVGCQAHRPVRG
jgi:hypothetical protein